MKLLRFFTLILFMSGASLVVAQTIDPVRITKADPATVKVNEETTVTIEATVTASETLIPNSINLLRYNQSNEIVANLGAMFDDGTNGDQVAGDRIYTRQISLKEVQAGSLLLKASVAYRGQMRRLLSASQEIKVTSASTANLSLTVLEPFDKAMVNEDTITIIGRFEGPLGIGISVNGVGAATSGNQFAAVLNLSPGENKIIVAASVINGASVEKSLTVTRSTVASTLQIVATEQEGLAPLRVGYLAQSTDVPISKMEIDVDGDGSFDVSTTDLTKPLYHNYQQAGLHQSIVQVTDVQQQKQQKKIVIVVQSKEEIDQTLRSLWDEFLQSLATFSEPPKQSNIAAFTREASEPVFPVVLSYLSGEAREVYNTVLTRVPITDIPQIILALRNPITLRISKNIAEYGVNRFRNGKKIAFIITYVKGEDGFWRIKAF